MKINFKQPKYVIPLIMLPFVIFGFFALGGSMKGNDKPLIAGKIDGLNPNLPNVDTTISKGQIADKFQAYQEAFKNAKDESAMGNIAPTTGVQQGLNYSSAYSPEDVQRMTAQRKMDSLTSAMQLGQQNIQEKLAQYNSGEINRARTQGKHVRNSRTSANGPEEDPLLNKLIKIQQQNSRGEVHQEEKGNDDLHSYENQMKLFHEQMQYMDSMQKANDGNASGEAGSGKKVNKTKLGTKPFYPGKDTTKALPIATALRQQSSFNTVRRFNSDENNIAAMIDQDVKVTLGSRVRIRLLKDMFVGEQIIKRGTYIYGVVTGFQKQRINISIAQILYHGTSLPVKIDLFDNDGYLGLYVPGSDFREFSKEIGTQASQGLSQAVTPDGSDIKMNMLSQLFNTTTTTLSSLMKKNNAYLKYNYIVYLKENKTASND